MQLKRYSTDKNLHYLFLQDNKMEGKDKLQVREGSKKILAVIVVKCYNR